MTQVLLEKKDGGLVFSASGHAGFDKKGSDIVCAAVTALTRTAMQTLAATAGIEFSATAQERGELKFAATVKEGLAAEKATAAKVKIEFLAEYLANGFKSLAKEFPNNIEYKLEA